MKFCSKEGAEDEEKSIQREQIIGILREAGAGSRIKTVCAARNISAATYHGWKRKFGGMEISEAKRLRASAWCGKSGRSGLAFRPDQARLVWGMDDAGLATS